MLKKSPKLTYCGLTIVMSNPSRFDRVDLLTANGGEYFRNKCLYPHHNLMQCEVRLRQDRSPLLPKTKAVLLLGLDAYNDWIGNAKLNSLGEVRGSIYKINEIAHIPSYLPQDCMDVKDFESQHNEFLQNKDSYEEATPDAAKSSKAEKRRHGVTARSNWKFWLKRDTEKAIRIMHNDGIVPEPPFKPDYIIYPSAKDIIDFLLSYKNNNLYLDIETDECFNIKCIGVSYDNSPVLVFPLLDYHYIMAYEQVPNVLRALVLAMRDNCIVSHNGSNFDWLILAWQYGLPLGTQFYDTMLAMHRCYPNVEKSLGHGTSLWTYEPFHKDEGAGDYRTLDDMVRLMQYCGKDVYTMKLIKHSIDAHASKWPGLKASIEQVNKSVRAYITMTLTGMHYRDDILESIVKENDRLMMQYLRCIKLLVGEDIIKTFQRRYKGPLPSSNPQCCAYFHDMLGYPVVARGKTRKDGTRHPSLGKKAIYVLRLRKENPVIDFTMAYRETQKETGSLQFEPWIPKEKV